MLSTVIFGVAREWVQTGAILLGVIVTAAAAAVGAYEYRLKARAERAESDTKLARLFADLIQIADGYRETFLPDGLAAALVEAKLLTSEDFEGEDTHGRNAASTKLKASMVTSLTGMTTMAATLRAIAELGVRHDLLRGPASEAMHGLAHHRDVEQTREAWETGSALLAQVNSKSSRQN